MKVRTGLSEPEQSQSGHVLETEQTGIRHARVGAEVCGMLWSLESGCKKYFILNWLNRTVTFGHFIETMEIHAKVEITILFPHKEHRGSVQRTARTYKFNVEMLVQELAQLVEFG